jgi:hypothetical protein
VFLSLVFAVFSTAWAQLQLDQFQDGGNSVNIYGEAFFAYSYGSATMANPLDGEDNLVAVLPVDGNVANGYAIQLQGFSISEGSGVGIMMEAGNSQLADCQAGFSYKFKGAAHVFAAEMRALTDYPDGDPRINYDTHFKQASAYGGTGWAEAVVALGDFHQDGWGTEVDFDIEDVYKLQWQVKTAGTGSLMVKDVQCLSTPAVIVSTQLDRFQKNGAETNVLAEGFSVFTYNGATIGNPLQNVNNEYFPKAVLPVDGNAIANGYAAQIQSYNLPSSSDAGAVIEMKAEGNGTRYHLGECVAGFSYKYKGAAHSFVAEMRALTDYPEGDSRINYDTHRKPVSASGGAEWAEVTVALNEFQQTGWGTEVDFDIEDVYSIRWVVDAAGTGSLMVKDIKCLGVSTLYASSIDGVMGSLEAALTWVGIAQEEAMLESGNVDEALIEGKIAEQIEAVLTEEGYLDDYEWEIVKAGVESPVAGIGVYGEHTGSPGYYQYNIRLEDKTTHEKKLSMLLTYTISPTPYPQENIDEENMQISAVVDAISEYFATARVFTQSCVVSEENLCPEPAKNDLKEYAAALLDALQEEQGLTYASIAFGADTYVPPVNGLVEYGNDVGTDGSYAFNIVVSNKAGTPVTINGLEIAAKAVDYLGTAEDNAALAAARAAIEAVFTTAVANSYSVKQASIDDEAAALAKINYVLDSLETNVSLTVTRITWVAPAAGTNTAEFGTDGYYAFRVDLKKGAGQALVLNNRRLNIIATPYDTIVPIIAKPSLAAGNIWLSVNGNTIQVYGISKAQTMRLLNANGKVVMSRIVTPNESVSIANLPNGVYMASIGGKTMRVAKR